MTTQNSAATLQNLYVRNGYKLMAEAEKMNLTDQTVMRSCYNLVKYYIMLGGNECHPKGDVFGKRSFPREARSALAAIIRPQSFPSAVFRGIG